MVWKIFRNGYLRVSFEQEKLIFPKKKEHRKAKELGEQAVMLLVKIIEGRENGNSGRTITSELIIRESCGIKI